MMCVIKRLLAIAILFGCIYGIRIDETCSGMRTLYKKGCSFELVLKIPNDGSGNYNLVLNTSMQTYTNEQIKVELKNKAAVRAGQANYITYVVTHPTCSIYPRITRLEFNGRVLCTNPPYDVSSGLPATQLSYHSTYKTNRSFKRIRSQHVEEHKSNRYSYGAIKWSSDRDGTCSGVLSFRQTYCAHAVVITIPSDGSGTYSLKLNATMETFTRIDLSVVLENEAAVQYSYPMFLTYIVTHPTCDKYPQITRLEFNGKVICTNPYKGNQPVTQFYRRITYFGQKRNKPTFDFNSNRVSRDFSTIHRYMNNPFLAPVARNATSSQQKPNISNSRNKLEIYPGNPFLNRNITRNINENSSNIRWNTNNSSTRSNKPCGYSMLPLIRGGIPVHSGEFPWLGGLFRGNNAGMEYICTVNLISQRHVLTAAHCVAGYTDTPRMFRVVFGFTKEPEQNYLTVYNIQIHPHYQRGKADHDAAFLTLIVTKSVSLPIPICVWQNQHEISDSGTIAGFGPDYTTFNKVKFPIVSQQVCRDSNIVFKFQTYDFTFCAGVRNGRGPCPGDSGSGFMQSFSDQYYLRGLVSHGVKSNKICNLDDFVVFSDLSKESHWIQEMLR